MSEEPSFQKAESIIGNNLSFRNATKDDAAFILQLRTDADKARYLSTTPHDLNLQIQWLERYAADSSQIYFIIVDRDNESVGTVRLYDKRGDSFCWGSWVLKSGVPSSYAIESALIVYCFASHLGFEHAHFQVRKANESVWKFHERFGAQRVGETDDDFIYTIDAQNIHNSIERYKKYLPQGITVHMLEV